MTHTSVVSVFMPTYNQETLVTEAIESVLAQDYSDWELIIGDDCSTDKTYEIISNYQKKYPDKIKPFRNNSNLGITKNFNKILSKCTGKYISFFAGDDVYLPGKLSNQTALMESNPNCILSYHDIDVFNSESGDTVKFWNSGDNGTNPITGNSKEVAKALVKDGTKFMAALSIMVKREAIPSNGHDERIPIASDWLLWIEICAQNDGEILFLDDVYARYRRHSNNITNKTKDHQEDLFVTLAIVESRYHFLTKLAQRKRAHFYYRRATQEVESNNYILARTLLKEHLRHSHISMKVIRCWIKSIYMQYTRNLPLN